MNQHQAPLFERLKAYAEQERVSFHMPGHKFGRNLLPIERAYFEQIMSIDFTELTGLDDLHDPQDVIQHAQELAARCFGAEQTFFLVNGSTVGNIALILATCQQDDILIVQRDAHKSVLHGLMLSGAKAVFLSPAWDEASGVSTGVRYEELEAALKQYPQAKAVFLTNPNYYGIGIDLRPIADLVHRYGIPLLVDEAHGAHFGFHPDLPPSALSCGADGVVQSTHKMLTAMTMGSMLHIQGSLLQPEIIQQRLSMLQSSSPSYPMMASLDISRRLIATEGTARLESGLQAVRQFKADLRQMPWFQVMEWNKQPEAQIFADPFKVVIRDQTGTCTGFQLQQWLETYGCFIEMADPVHIVLLFSLSSTAEDGHRFIHALQQISQRFQLDHKQIQEHKTNSLRSPFSRITSPLKLNMPVHPQRWKDRHISRPISIDEAVGYRCAEMIIPYPPGIPLLFPGERVTQEIADWLKRLAATGATFQAAKDKTLHTILVYDQAGNEGDAMNL